MTQFSEKTISKLADTLVEDVIDYIMEDERLNEFYHQVKSYVDKHKYVITDDTMLPQFHNFIQRVSYK